jgi:hypothetical protein
MWPRITKVVSQGGHLYLFSKPRANKYLTLYLISINIIKMTKKFMCMFFYFQSLYFEYLEFSYIKMIFLKILELKEYTVKL